MRRKKVSASTQQQSTPQQDLDNLGPVVRQNHIAYVPQPAWSNVPGCGIGNLIYAPDFLLSAPEWFAGNTHLRTPNFPMIAKPPQMIIESTVTTDGIGGVQTGTLALQQLLEVSVDNSQITG